MIWCFKTIKWKAPNLLNFFITYVSYPEKLLAIGDFVWCLRCYSGMFCGLFSKDDEHTYGMLQYPHKGFPWITQSKFKIHLIWILINLSTICLSVDYINWLGAFCMLYSFCYKCSRIFFNRSFNPSFAYSPCISTIQGGWIWVKKNIRIYLGFKEREETCISEFPWLYYV